MAAKSGDDLYEYRSESRYVIPVAQYRISVVHDYKEALLPYFDTAIKNYNTPFTFVIKPIGGIAVVQAQMFVGGEWFPKMPKEYSTAMDIDALFSRPVFSIPVVPLAAVGGPKEIYSEVCKISDSEVDMEFLRGLSAKRYSEIIGLNKMVPVLQVILLLL